MADLSITISDIEINNALSAVLRLDRLRNPQPLYKAWANYLERLVVQAYKTETAPFGAGWPALRPATLKRKKRSTILRESGALYDSTVAQVLPDGVQVGSNLGVNGYSLLAIHQFGASIKREASSRNLNFKVNQRTGRSRFAKASKANFQQRVNIGAYTINIPARRVLPMDAAGEVLPQMAEELLLLTDDYLRG